jgi:DNA-binding NarL/FixJ family response regulator
VPDADQDSTLRFTCPPCGDVFAADDEDTLIAVTIEHARKLHDIDLFDQFSIEQLRQQVRRENALYWDRIGHLVPRGRLKTVFDERLCDREREIVGYVVHGFTNREIADRLGISGRTVSTHLVNIYEKLDVHSRAELTVLVRAADHVIEAGLRSDARKEFGPFKHVNGPTDD